MDIRGQNNRIAGRDYYENAVLKLTPEQLQIAIKPCARCEDRLVGSEASICNHCYREMRAKAQREKWSLFAFLVMVVWGNLLIHSEKTGVVVTPYHLAELGVMAAALVFAATLVWVIVRDWWLVNGTEFLKALGKLLVRLWKKYW